MAVNFPSSPTANQTYTYGDRSWVWSGAYWRATTTGSFGSISVSGNITLSGAIIANNSTGATGQVLTSTGTGVQWATSTAGGGSSNAPIKTFNVLGNFGQLTGTAKFYPSSADTLKSVIISVSGPVIGDLMLSFKRNNNLLQYFTLPSGQSYIKFTNLSYPINSGEYYTIDIVAGAGSNLSVALFDINL